MPNNELHRHKRSDKIKWVFTAIAFILVAALLVGLFLQVFGTGKMRPSEWFNQSTEEQTPEENESGLLEETFSHGVKLTSNTIAVADYENYGISPLAETAYTLTATVYDEGGSTVGIPQNVNFSAAWEQGYIRLLLRDLYGREHRYGRMPSGVRRAHNHNRHRGFQRGRLYHLGSKLCEAR